MIPARVVKCIMSENGFALDLAAEMWRWCGACSSQDGREKCRYVEVVVGIFIVFTLAVESSVRIGIVRVDMGPVMVEG